MKTLSLEVVSIDGKKLNISKALIRVFIAIPSVMTGVWLIFGLIRKDCQCPHDILSGTMLVIKKNGEK